MPANQPAQEPPPLPEPRRRRFRTHTDEEFSVALKTVTPILGGSFFTAGDAIEYRTLDTIRVPSIRGHLRFWWRALQPAGQDWRALHESERSIWGGMGGGGDDKDAAEPKASQVNVSVESIQPSAPEIDDSEPPADGRGYAMFPARHQEQNRIVIRPPVPRLRPGITFTLRISCPAKHLPGIRKAVQAWILFGGYGSRTRRGLGSLTVTADVSEWLPTTAMAGLITTLLTGQGSVGDTPTLAGSALVVGEPNANADRAWDLAVGQLQYFRQQRGFAREQGTNRPGQSRWPEPDKIRHITRKTAGHRPRFGDTPAWPRAQFGLPIVGRFTGGPQEPGAFQIQWQADGENQPSDRLASPLIVKALPLADGKFAPCALWLARGFPRGKVVLVTNNHAHPESAAAFDTMQGAGDDVLHEKLRGKTSVRQAFFDWLVGDCHWRRVSG